MIEKRLVAKPLIKKIYSELKAEIAEKGESPQLVILLIGEDPASEFYVNNLQKKGKKVGIGVDTKIFDKQIAQAEIMAEIEKLNSDESVHGIMLQKPLPQQLDESEIVMKIDPDKDVDGFHPINVGNLVLAREGFVPSTPQAVLEILKYYQISTNGKQVCVLGRSDIVGKPMANLLLRKDETGNATVTICHSRTKNLADITRQADILIAAIGQARFVSAEMIKPGAIVIDVGVNQIADAEKGQRYVGDVDYDACFEKAKAITPVPRGVGSVTTAMLLSNVLKAKKKCSAR